MFLSVASGLVRGFMKGRVAGRFIVTVAIGDVAECIKEFSTIIMFNILVTVSVLCPTGEHSGPDDNLVICEEVRGADILNPAGESLRGVNVESAHASLLALIIRSQLVWCVGWVT